jgi:hypothetical protein
MNLKTVIYPRKALNKSIGYIDYAIHPLGCDLKRGISFNIFVCFVFFVNQLLFLG